MDTEVATKETNDEKNFLSCSRLGRRNAYGKIICKCQLGNPEATEHAKDCAILASEKQDVSDESAEQPTKTK